MLRTFLVKRTVFSINTSEQTGYSLQKNETRCLSFHLLKTNSKCIKVININKKHKNMKLMEENIGSILCSTKKERDFCKGPPKHIIQNQT
jgi:hypothetical protein